MLCCLRYCKSTIFQANHNQFEKVVKTKVLFAILQKYDFSSKSQQHSCAKSSPKGCLRYCKSTIFQANHNQLLQVLFCPYVVCDTAKVRFFKQITTAAKEAYALKRCLRYCKSTIFQANHNDIGVTFSYISLFAILQKYDFSSKSQHRVSTHLMPYSCLRYCKSTIFQANHNLACCWYLLKSSWLLMVL